MVSLTLAPGPEPTWPPLTWSVRGAANRHRGSETEACAVCWRWWRGAGMSGGVGWKMATLAAVLGVVALTVWAAVAAGAVKGPGGVVAGAVLTALAALYFHGRARSTATASLAGVSSAGVRP